MDRCRTCQYFDRRNAITKENKSATWGQCRRDGPRLSPHNQKPHMIEGVWPHVRDDDWCGEYKGLGKRLDADLTDLMENPTLTGVSADPATKPMFIPIASPRDPKIGSNGD
jgi:hypothetical protein